MTESSLPECRNKKASLTPFRLFQLPVLGLPFAVLPVALAVLVSVTMAVSSAMAAVAAAVAATMAPAASVASEMVSAPASSVASAMVSAMAAGPAEETEESKVTSIGEATEEAAEEEVGEMSVKRTRAATARAAAVLGVLVVWMAAAVVAAEVAPRVLSSFGVKVAAVGPLELLEFFVRSSFL